MKAIKQKLWVSAIACFVLLWMEPSRVAADFIVTAWTLSSSVRDFQAGPGHNDLKFSTTVQNPYAQSLNAAYSNSVAQATHDFVWNLATGQFNTNVHIEAQGGPNFRSGTDNLVRFTPSTDVLLTVDAQWQFQMPGGDRISDFFILAGEIGFPATFMNHAFNSSTVFGGPHTATWSVQDSVLLPAGREYFFRSIFRFWNLNGTPTSLSVGNGYANFTLTKVPSPAAFGPLAFAVLLIRKRGRATQP